MAALTVLSPMWPSSAISAWLIMPGSPTVKNVCSTSKTRPAASGSTKVAGWFIAPPLALRP